MPIHKFNVAWAVTTPALLLAAFVQTKYEVGLFEQYQAYLPEELKDNRVSSEIQTETLTRYLILTVVFMMANYLQQRQGTTLIIEKNYASKQQKQLESFFRSQKNAIIIYKLKDLGGNNAEPSNSFDMEANERNTRFLLHFVNEAVKNMLNLDVQDLEQSENTTRKNLSRFKVFPQFEDEAVENSRDQQQFRTLVDILSKNSQSAQETSMHLLM